MISFSKDWYKQKSNADHLIAVIYNLCQLLRIPVTLTGIRSAVKSHPNYPSLLSIAQSLERFGINNEALKGTVNDLSEDDYPSIAHLKSDQFIIIEEIDQEGVQFIDPAKGRIYCILEDFEKIWSGVLLRVTIGQKAGEKDFPLKRKKEIYSNIRKILVLPALILLITAIFSYGLRGVANSGKLLALWGVKLSGLFICLTLFNESPIMQYACAFGKKVNCRRVLNSPAGKLFGISMSELGIFYFSSGLLTLLLMHYMEQVELTIFLLAILNLLTLPYTIFSVLYQALVIKSWCLLCLSIQTLFWIEFFLLLNSISIGVSNISLPLTLPLIMGFAISVLVWIEIRNILIKAKRAVYLEQKLFWSNVTIRQK
jgi:uncharacterized membrane protein